VAEKAPGRADKAGNGVVDEEGNPRTSSDGRWRVGDRIFNHDRGYGEVIAIHEGGHDAGPVISVRYENGKLQRFLSRSMSGRFMKIRE
jgi:DNA helicase-2/ATP-dependent DNA helicase PcrA